MTNDLPHPLNAPQSNSFAAALSRLLATTAAFRMEALHHAPSASACSPRRAQHTPSHR